MGESERSMQPPHSTSLIEHLGRVSGCRCWAAGPRGVLVLARNRVHTRVQTQRKPIRAKPRPRSQA